jgi:dGTPase
LGHTPFGHAGEEVLNELVPGGFHHHEQSIRLVDLLERDGRGLNLTWETRDGIACHSKARASIVALGAGVASTLEGQVLKLSDSIAYINHDILDAIRAGIITPDDLPASCIEVIGRKHSERINSMVCDIIETSWSPVRADESSAGQSEQAYRAATSQIADLANQGIPMVSMSDQMLSATDALRGFLFENVYAGSPAQHEMRKVKGMLAALYHHYLENPESLPAEYQLAMSHSTHERIVCDYISGMTDLYALKTYEELFVPRLWTQA